MRKFFKGKVYDTEKSVKIAYISFESFDSDTLYCSPKGTFFLHSSEIMTGHNSVKVFENQSEAEEWLENDGVISICIEDYFDISDG